MSEQGQISASQQAVRPAGSRKTFGAATRFLIARAAEPSSWRGAIFMLSSLGIVLRPEVSAAIIAAGMGVAGLIAVLVPDSASPQPGTE